MTIFGQVTDQSNVPMEFATVFVSDAKGKPLQPNRSTTTDTKGMYKLDNVSDSDFVTVRYVGMNPTTVSAKKVIRMPLLNSIGNDPIYMPTLNIKMSQSEANTLAAVEVVADKPKPKSNLLRNGLIAGGLLLAFAVIAYGSKKA